MTATAFTKVVRLGTVPNGRRNISVFAKVSFDGSRLSMTGVEGPTRGGNAVSCGQIDMHLTADSFAAFAPGWDHGTVAKFLDTWGRWHMNDCRAGSPRQRDAVRQMSDKGFLAARTALEAAGLSPDSEFMHNGKPYAFGSAWLFEEVPADVLAFLSSLPDTDKTPAWV